jgi:hypothetical protein
MDWPVTRGASTSTPRRRGLGRNDLAMSVLQYGTAIVAIIAVTLLALVR